MGFFEDLLGLGDQKQKVTSEPWKQLSPYLIGLLQGAYDWYANPYFRDADFPFSTIAWFTPEQQLAMNMQTMRSYFGDPLNNAGTRLATSTVLGDFVNPASNPYLGPYFQVGASDLVNTYLNTALPQIRSTAQKAGMGSSTADALLQGQLARQLGDSLQKLATGIYGGAYEKERQIQNQMLQLIPQFNYQIQSDIANLAKVGDIKQQMASNVLQEVRDLWASQYAKPYNRLSQYANLMYPILGAGGTQATTMPGGGILSSVLWKLVTGSAGSSLFPSPASTWASTGPIGASMGRVTPFASGSEAAGWDLFI